MQKNTYEQDSGHPDFLPSSIEQKNRVILVLVLLLVVFMFMDYQAKRHYQSVVQNQKKSSSNASPKHTSSFEEDLQDAKEKLENELKKQDEDIQDKVPIKAEAKTILGSFNKLKESLQNAVETQTAAEIQQVKATPIHAENILTKLELNHSSKNQSPPTDQIIHKKKHYFLYFIRFVGKKSRIIAVRRLHPKPQGTLSLKYVLEQLRKGPKHQEKGLLNNFDQHIQIKGISLVGKIAVVNLNSAIGRMGVHVIHDRLEQLSHTLTQFNQVDAVQLLVDDKLKKYIGNAQVNVPKNLKPKHQSFLIKDL